MEGWINRLAVDPEFRGRGLAKRLISEVEGRLRARGRRIIAVLVEGGMSQPSLRLFQSCGYLLNREILHLSKRDSPEV